MQAIETKYLGPTNARGSRIAVKAQAGRIYVPYDPSRGSDENHAAAILAFARKWEWYGVWYMGGKADGRGNVAVCVTRDRHDAPKRIEVRDAFATLAEWKAEE